MVRGFYQIGSGIMAQNKVINTIANNLANSNTSGYKAQETVTTSFSDMLTARVGTTATGTETTKNLYDRSWINVVSDTITNFDQGATQLTDRNLDFCITGEGFFQIAAPSGKVYYTRDGDFDLDQGGYLSLAGAGRVQDVNGDDIYIGTDDITVASNGEIYDNNSGALYGKVALYDFPDHAGLVEFNNTMYTTDQEPNLVEATLNNKKLESSNIDLAEEITSAMEAQNLLQSQANILQMYADVLSKASEKIGQIR